MYNKIFINMFVSECVIIKLFGYIYNLFFIIYVGSSQSFTTHQKYVKNQLLKSLEKNIYITRK